jgi:histidinol-phosphate aminotransferase
MPEKTRAIGPMLPDGFRRGRASRAGARDLVRSAGVTGPVRHTHPWLRAAPTFAVGEPPSGALRLDLNEGAYGPTPSALAAIRAGAGTANRYPDPIGGHGLRAALATRLGVAADALLFGPGSNSVASLLIRICVAPGSRVAYTWPGFPTYGWAASRAGATPVPIPARPDGSDDLAALAAAAADAEVVVLATPNNPTGRYVTDGLRDFVAEASRSALVIVDEAYHEYAPPAESGLDLYRSGGEVVVLRTFSKAWGLAGARIGYGVMAPDLQRVARAAQDTFEVSSLAFRAARAALDDEQVVRRRCRENAGCRTALEQTLARLRLDYWPSAANFVCCQPAAPDQFVDRMREHGVIVRTIAAFGDPSRVRIGVPGRRHLDRVLAAVESSVA